MTTERPRARLLSTTIAMVGEQGVHAAALSELLKRSNTSRNSLYQHFPDGKGELVETAARIVSRLVHSHLTSTSHALAETPSAGAWLDQLFSFWREPLEESKYRRGSFMMAAALDESDPDVQAAAGQAFTEWAAALSNAFGTAGLSEADARAVAGLLLSSIEGAIVVSRALECSTPFDDARDQLAILLCHHLPTKTH